MYVFQNLGLVLFINDKEKVLVFEIISSDKNKDYFDIRQEVIDSLSKNLGFVNHQYLTLTHKGYAKKWMNLLYRRAIHFEGKRN